MRIDVLAEWDWTSPELPVDNMWFCAVVLVLLVFFIWVIARLTASTTEDIDPAEAHRQMLTTVSELRSRGELTPEEYRSIKSRLVDRLSDEPPSADSEDSSHEDQRRDENEGQPGQTSETPVGTAGSDDESMADSRDDPSLDEISEKDQHDQSELR